MALHSLVNYRLPSYFPLSLPCSAKSDSNTRGLGRRRRYFAPEKSTHKREKGREETVLAPEEQKK